MRTRLLETKDVLRACANKAQVLATARHSVVLKTSAVLAAKKEISSADPEMAQWRQSAQSGQSVEGCLRIDVLADHVLRVRYALGQDVPPNPTRMVVGELKGPSKCRITPSAIKTPAMTVAIRLDTYQLGITDAAGRSITNISGPEKDHFCAWDSYNTGIHRALDAGLVGGPIATESFELFPGHCIYGLGERFIRLDKVGQTLDLNQLDALGVTTPRAYKNVPLFLSTQGYGVFFNHSSRMTCWLGSMSACDVQVAAEDEFLDYFVIVGDIKTILDTYTDLTGKGRVPPKWTFGFWQSKISYSSAAEVVDIVGKLRRHKIPCDLIALDTHWYKQDWLCDLEFDKTRFPDPPQMLKRLADMGVKVCLWQLPYIPAGSRLFDDLRAVGGFVKNLDGSLHDTKVCFTPSFGGISAIIDFTNPQAVRVYQEYLARLFRMGIKAIKADFGEAAPIDNVKYHDGTPPHQMHNLYPLLYNQAVAEVTERETGSALVWGRSAWAGSQRYPLHWGGDSSPNYPNMAPQVEGGLSLGLSGFQFWSQDIGGFCGDTNDRLLTRWMQMSMFMSHIRIHGTGDRELYKFSRETVRICRDYLRLRYRLLPYIESQAIDCVARSLPMLRALVVDYQDDPNTWRLGDQFLFGSDLLVAPIYHAGTDRRVYLPAGVWTDWWTGKRTRGPRWIDVHAGLEKLPLWIREGAIIPMGPVLNYVDERPIDLLDLRIGAFDKDGRTRISVPVNGESVAIEYSRRNGRHRVTVGPTRIKVAAKIHGGGNAEVVRRNRKTAGGR